MTATPNVLSATSTRRPGHFTYTNSFTGRDVLADEAGAVADAFGLDADEVWGAGVFEAAYANLSTTRIETVDGVASDVVVPSINGSGSSSCTSTSSRRCRQSAGTPPATTKPSSSPRTTSMIFAEYDPLDVVQWDFYVLPRRQIEALGQKSLGLATLARVAGDAIPFDQLSACVDHAYAIETSSEN